MADAIEEVDVEGKGEEDNSVGRRLSRCPAAEPLTRADDGRIASRCGRQKQQRWTTERPPWRAAEDPTAVGGGGLSQEGEGLGTAVAGGRGCTRALSGAADDFHEEPSTPDERVALRSYPARASGQERSGAAHRP